MPDDSHQTQPTSDDARWIHASFTPLATDRNGPFLLLPDDQLLTADTEGLLTSADDGRTWSLLAPASFGQDPREPASFYLLRTAAGALVMVYLDMARRAFNWDDEAGEPQENCRLELWAVRSLDGGRTWVARQRLLDSYNGNFFGFLQIRGGRLVVVAEHLVTQPGRWVACSLCSDDEGQTWKRSNLVDLGGHGNHDGATEPMLAELSDGRLLMLIRTNLGRFWEAYSEDGGCYWRTTRPSPIAASSAPGRLLRLQSGRLVLVWNRPAPAGGSWPLTPPSPLTEVAASWYREELSISVSGDDGQTWSDPLVLARQVGGQLSYPFLLERRPGELWITAGFAFRHGWEDPLPLRVQVREEELARLLQGG
jgi:hypothetical protein